MIKSTRISSGDKGTVNAKITEEKSKGASKKGRKRFALVPRFDNDSEGWSKWDHYVDGARKVFG